MVYRYGILMVVMAFLSLIFGALAGKFAASASSGFAANLREAIYDRIQTFSFSNIDKVQRARPGHPDDHRRHQRADGLHDGDPGGGTLPH